MSAFVKQHIRPGSTVYTDGLKGFEDLRAAGVKHRSADAASTGRVAQRCALRGAARRSRYRQPPAVADRHVPWSQQGATPGLPRRVRLSAQSSTTTDGCLSNAARFWDNTGPDDVPADSRRSRCKGSLGL